MDVFAVGEGDVFLCYCCFERKDTDCAGAAFGKTCKAEHVCDVRLILCANLLHVRGGREIVITVGKLETTLKQVRGVAVGVVEAGRDPEAEDICGVEVGVVEGVDVGAEGEAEGVGGLVRGVDGSDGVEVRLQRWEAVGFDGGLVHVGVVEVGDLALVGARGGVGLGGVFDDAGGLLEAEVCECAEDADGGAVWGEFGAGEEAAVGVEVEVVAGADGGVHVGDGDAVGQGRGGLGWRYGRGEGEESDAEKSEEVAGDASHESVLRSAGSNALCLPTGTLSLTGQAV